MTNDFFLPETGVDYNVEEKAEPIRAYDEKLPLFDGPNNPNHEIFVIATQEGADKEDQGHGSIGDATMDHVSRMRHKLREMEHFFMMPNGNLFRVEENVQALDEASTRYTRNQMMQVITDNNLSTDQKEGLISFFEEEIEERKKEREERQDAMEQILVPYEEWEAMPQLTREWDVPPTPKPLYIYAGTTKQMFYDVFPEGHPDERRINAFISAANSIDWDDWSVKTVEYFVQWMERREWVVPTCVEHLLQFCEKVSSGDMRHTPTEHMIEALQEIDRDWGVAITKNSINQFKQSPVMQEIQNFEKKVKDYPQGALVWGEIGKLGRRIYEKFGREATTAHWAQYRNLKKKYAPTLLAGNIDFNSASIQELTKFFMKTNSRKKADKKAREVFYSRPFMSLEDLAAKNLIGFDDISYTDKNVAFISLLKNAKKKCLQSKSRTSLGELSQRIIAKQQEKPGMMSQEEWSAVWQAYRLAKKEVDRVLLSY